ncbi:hypothetical protein JXL19_00730 [bacterium]|nr:hypothetical protein [bacterium]
MTGDPALYKKRFVYTASLFIITKQEAANNPVKRPCRGFGTLKDEKSQMGIFK